ncbi:MAG: redoxin domain-containing protein [Planctomycetia bacterium]
MGFKRGRTSRRASCRGRFPAAPIVVLLLALACGAVAGAEETDAVLPVDRLVGTKVGDFRLPDVVAGQEVWFYGLARANGFLGRVMGLEPVRAAVLVFVAPGCPLGEKYLPRLGELATKYGPRGIRFFAVASGAGESAENLAAWARKRTLPFPLLHDVGNVVADAVMVERSNECIVVDARGVMRYRGAIDDQHGYDASLPEPRHRWLADAIDAILADPSKRIEPRGTPVAGCLLTKKKPDPSKLASLDRVRPASADIAAWLEEHEPAPRIEGPVTWNGDVAAILQAKCQSCHRPGQVGGFSLLTYDDAFRQSAMIGEVVENRRMPPWHADPRHGRFSNDRRLSAADRAKVLALVAAGGPRGDGPEPAARGFVEGWTVGEPDVVFEIPAANAVPAQGTMPYVNVRVPTNFTEDVWVQAAEARPGDPGVVHHIIVFVDEPGKRRGSGVEGLGHLCGYAPGDMPSVYPPGTAKRIPAGSTLRFQIHYTPNGVATTDRSRVGLILAKEPPEREAVTLGIANPRFVIPPGAAAHPVRSQVPVLRPTRLLSFMPHMHLRGRSFRYTLEQAGSRPEVLLEVPAYDFGWQSYYLLAEPRDLSPGAKIVCDAVFDNSSANPANPDPTKAVTWGEQTWEEMMIGYVDVDFPRSIARAPATPATE